MDALEQARQMYAECMAMVQAMDYDGEVFSTWRSLYLNATGIYAYKLIAGLLAEMTEDNPEGVRAMFMMILMNCKHDHSLRDNYELDKVERMYDLKKFDSESRKPL